MDELLAEGSDAELAEELASSVAALETDVDKLELAALLSGTYDASDAIATINAGAGGTESQDWAEMLLRMYMRWAERGGSTPRSVTSSTGTRPASSPRRSPCVARTSTACSRPSAACIGWSASTPSTRRSAATSFASLDVIPMLEASDEGGSRSRPTGADRRVPLSGPGGQSVNTTDSAVRITHIPTGIVAACQNERSQLQNKAVAMRILKARLQSSSATRRDEEMAEIRGERKAVDFGSQIRSYVLAPYQMVKDHRTDEEIGDPQRVLDGDIDRFIEAELRRRAAAS